MKAYPRDIDVNTLKERHVGIENELAVGIAGVTSRGDLPEYARKIINRRGLLQSVGMDGGGREFRTNPIKLSTLKKVRGHKYLCEYYDVLSENSRVISSGGTHIHISILDKDHVNMESNATAMSIAFFKQFQKIAGRRSDWAYRLNRRTLSEVRDGLRLASSECGNRTYGRNGSMLYPTYHKTLEFRGPKGSNNKTEILAWIEFLENVVNLSNQESIEGVQFKDLLKGERISEYVKNIDESWRQLTKAELEQKFDGSKLY